MALGLYVAVCGTCAAAVAPLPGNHRTVGQWDVREGLPDSFVAAIAIGPEGALWLTMRTGMARFNGRDVRRMTPAGTPVMAVTPFVFDTEGVGWVAAVDGIRFTKTPQLMDPETRRELEGTSVDGRTTDGTGALWLVSDKRLGRYAGWSVSWTALPPELASTEYVRPVGLASGGVVLLGEKGMAASRDGKEWQNLGRPEGMTDPAWYLADEDPEGGIWVSWVKEDIHAARWKDGKWEEVPADDLAETGRILCFAKGPGGAWIAGTERGWVLDLAAGPTALKGRKFLPRGAVLSLAVDRANHWWLGTDRSGLLRVCREVGELWSPAEPQRCRSAVEYEGRFLVGSLGGGLLEKRGGGPLERIDFPPGRQSVGFVNALLATDEGLWMGGERELQLWRHGSPGPETMASVGSDDVIFALARDEAGHLLAGTRGGKVLRLRTGTDEFERVARRVAFMIVGLQVAHGRYWVATERGLKIVQDGALVPVPDFPHDGVACRAVLACRNGLLAAGLVERGLVIISDGKTTTLGPDRGLEVPDIHQLVQDARGDLWLGTIHGIARLSMEEITACVADPRAMLRPVFYGEDSGLRSDVCTWAGSPSATLFSDGRLAFPTNDGVTVIDPAEPPPLQLPPRAYVTDVEVDGRFYEGGEKVDLSAVPRPRALRLHFEAVDIEHPGDAVFRWRVDPSSTGWISAGDQRAVTFLNPSAGSQTVHLQVRNRNGQWSGDTAVELVFSAHWWELPWVRAAGLLLVAGLPLWGLQRRYALREKQRALDQMADRRLHAERSRIARDIHDDMGNRLSEIQLLAEGIQTLSGNQDRLDRLHARTVGAVEALDELVWMLNPRNDTWPSLARFLEKETVAYLDAADVATTFRVEGALPGERLHPAQRHALVLALREILHNAVRHGRPRRVTVTLRCDGHAATLRVGDDGRGFDHAAARQLGRGLHGLESRAQELGGTVRVASGPDGTDVSLTLPLERNLKSPII